jgi:hypothetical protein
MSTETALFLVNHRLEDSLNQREIASGAFLEIEGAFDISTFHALIAAARERGLQESCCRCVGSMLNNRLLHTSIMGSSMTAKVIGGYPQVAGFSPLLWNLVVDRLLNVTNVLGFRIFG